MKICCWCGSEIFEDEEFVLFVGQFSHIDCEKRFIEEQEKKTKYTKKINSEHIL